MKIAIFITASVIGSCGVVAWRFYCARLYRKWVGETIYQKRRLHEFQPGEISKAMDAKQKTDGLFMFGFMLIAVVMSIVLCLALLAVHS